MRISRRSVDALIEFETGGRAYYKKHLANPSWPGGQSGVTIGVGFDLGYESREAIADAWRPVAFERRDAANFMRYLLDAHGIRGKAARKLAEKGAWISIEYDDAMSVFVRHTLVTEARKTARTFPGVQLLPPDAQGALVSLVFNRGTSLVGDDRREMRAIADTLLRLPDRIDVPTALAQIWTQIRLMKRLWEGQALDGLLKRRDAEAALLAGSMRHYDDSDILEIT